MSLFSFEFKRSVLVQNTRNCGCVPSLPTIILEKRKNNSDLTHMHASNPNISYINISYRTSKRLHYSKLISQSDNKQRTTWNIIRTLTNNKKASNIDIPINNNNDESSINPINTANAFNTYFTSVAYTLLTKNFFETDTNNNDDPIDLLTTEF